MFTNIIAIAVNTFKEAIRKKVFYLILIFIMVMIGVAVALANVSLEETERVIVHFGLFSINIFGVLIAVFVGAQLIYEETERKTIYTAVSHGVTRTEFILGKFFGLYLTIFTLAVFMSLLLALLFASIGVGVDYGEMFRCIVLLLLEMLIVCSIVILFDSLSTPVLASVLTVLYWFICNFTLDIENHANVMAEHQGQTVLPIIFKGLYTLLPNFGQYNQIRAVIYPQDPVVLDPVLLLLALLFTTVHLSLACWAFHTKDFE